jgi:class 3 adenylate cyclase
MTVIYRYCQEHYFAKPPAAIWPFVSDTARLWELVGNAPYRFEERVDAQGRVRRLAHGKIGPLPVTWEEDFGEWQENRRLFHVREYHNGPMRRFEWSCDLFPEGEGCRLLLTGVAETVGVLGFVARHAGILNADFSKPLTSIERLVRESDDPTHIPAASVKDLLEPAARRRLDALAGALARDPASHGLASNLSNFLRHAPVVALRSIRPLALARTWSVDPEHAVELFLAATRNGIVAMGWDLLCPRCRGAKSRVSRLHELPKGAHCSSCNIDYERNFSRNVELTFHPEPWVRPLPDGELCMLGPGVARHIKFQAEVAAGSAKSFELSLAPGPYRFRTVEAGAEVDGEIGAGGVIPTLVARGRDIRLEGASGRHELAIRNESDRPLAFVVEDRHWAQDGLTGERVIAMPAFRRLCPEQLLRPDDNAEIGSIAIMFTDLKGSTELYEALGDVTAYNLVRDHFDFLVERVKRNHGFVVKTVGDAVMAAFFRPYDAVRAALAIQDDIAGFNVARGESMNPTPIVLKLGIHAGSCIAVTTSETLDYFGATVNIAARLANECRGGEAIVSVAVANDVETGATLADRMQREETAALRGVSEPVRFVRVRGLLSASVSLPTAEV